MTKIFRRNDGQVAPFMIAIIVVLIMAIMVTVNIGKVSLTKTRTANAADAGALAGSTTHANTLNALADANTQMIADYLSMQIMFLIPFGICTAKFRYVAYLAFVAAQTTMFILAWNNANKGYQEAQSAAKQLAFMNAGIDEAKVRLTGESYQDYLRRESPFGQWMANKGYDSGVYSWTNKQGGQNSFTVSLQAPDFPGLIPMPMVLTALYFDWFSPCVAHSCALCAAQMAVYNACLGAGWLSQLGEKLLTHSVAVCGGVAWNVIIYFVPIAWIAGIVKDNPEMTVNTTRIESPTDLGIWQMKYNDPVRGNQGISSEAKSRASGGAIGPFPSPRYDSNLISGGY